MFTYIYYAWAGPAGSHTLRMHIVRPSAYRTHSHTFQLKWFRFKCVLSTNEGDFVRRWNARASFAVKVRLRVPPLRLHVACKFECGCRVVTVLRRVSVEWMLCCMYDTRRAQPRFGRSKSILLFLCSNKTQIKKLYRILQPFSHTVSNYHWMFIWSNYTPHQTGSSASSENFQSHNYKHFVCF